MTSTRDLTAQIVGLRKDDGHTLDAPGELGFHCPVCQYSLFHDDEYDARLKWSQYNGFLSCSCARRTTRRPYACRTWIEPLGFICSASKRLSTAVSRAAFTHQGVFLPRIRQPGISIVIADQTRKPDKAHCRSQGWHLISSISSRLEARPR
jgi:hypothetical protein